MKPTDFQRYCDKMPAPIALSLNKAAHNIETSGQIQDLCSVLEVFTRYLVAIAHAEYCMHAKDDRVQEVISVTQQPIANGNALRRCTAIFRFLCSRKHVFCREIVDWYFDRNGTESKNIELLKTLIEKRNRFVHKDISTREMKSFSTELMRLFASTSWLERYELFVVLTQKPSEPTGTEGTLRWMMGLESPADIKESHWTNVRLYNQELYLLHPEQKGFLRMSPFLIWREDELKNSQTVFLWTKIGRNQIEYQSMYSRSEYRSNVLRDKKEMGWERFVETHPFETVLWLDSFEQFALPAIDSPEEESSSEELSAEAELGGWRSLSWSRLLWGLLLLIVLLVLNASSTLDEHSEANRSPSHEVTIRFSPTPPTSAIFRINQKPVSLQDGLLLVELEAGIYPLELEIEEKPCSLMVESLSVSSDLAIQIGWDCLGRAGYKMKRIPKGEYTLGAPKDMKAQDPDEERRDVALDYAYEIGIVEVTQRFWLEHMGTNPSHFSDCPSCPVENISWFDAVSFANHLSEEEFLESCYEIIGRDVIFQGLSCAGYRLPTEAEWEIAARGGRAFVYSGSQSPVRVAVFQFNSQEKTAPVASLQPNDYGLYDMSGNVYEWCQDTYGSTARLDRKNPLNDGKGEQKVGRGGSYRSAVEELRVMNRSSAIPTMKQPFIGIRLARSVPLE